MSILTLTYKSGDRIRQDAVNARVKLDRTIRDLFEKLSDVRDNAQVFDILTHVFQETENTLNSAQFLSVVLAYMKEAYETKNGQTSETETNKNNG